MQEIVIGPEADKFPEFSPGAIKALERMQCPVYDLYSRSIKDYRGYGGSQGVKFRSPSRTDYPYFEKELSRRGQASFDPIALFISYSFREPYDVHQEILVDYNNWLSKKIPDVRAIVGGYPDWFQITMKHFHETRKRLFGEAYGNLLTRTKDTLVYGNVVFGDFRTDDGPMLGSYSSNEGFSFIGLAPLIVPA